MLCHSAIFIIAPEFIGTKYSVKITLKHYIFQQCTVYPYAFAKKLSVTLTFDLLTSKCNHAVHLCSRNCT